MLVNGEIHYPCLLSLMSSDKVEGSSVAYFVVDELIIEHFNCVFFIFPRILFIQQCSLVHFCLSGPFYLVSWYIQYGLVIYFCVFDCGMFPFRTHNVNAFRTFPSIMSTTSPCSMPHWTP